MNYCPNCHVLCHDDHVCPTCGGEVRPPEPGDSVMLVSDREYETLGLCTALSEADLPFAQSRAYSSMTSAKARGFGNICSILVPYENYNAAKEIAKAQGFRFPDDVTVTPADQVGKPGQKSPQAAEPKEEEEVSPAKKKLGRLLLFLCVIAAVALVVFFSDSVLGFIKGLFQ